MIIWVIKIFFCICFCVFLTLLNLLLLLRPYCFCPLSCQSFHDIFLRYLQFSWRDLYSFPLYIFFSISFNSFKEDRLRRPSYLSLIFSGTGFFFFFLLYLSLSLLLFASLHFQGKPFNITVIQVYASTTDAKDTEVDRFYDDLQHFLELTPPKVPISS